MDEMMDEQNEALLNKALNTMEKYNKQPRFIIPINKKIIRGGETEKERKDRNKNLQKARRASLKKKVRVVDIIEKNPATPFQWVRFQLKMSARAVAGIIGISAPAYSLIENGRSIPNAVIAKRIQNIARERGLAVTLDELYQHVSQD